MKTVFESTNSSLLTLVDILSWWAQHSSLQEAYTFLLDGEAKQAQIKEDLDGPTRQ